MLDYRYFDSKKITPRYEFGHGLSYTTFKYSDLDIRLKWNKHTKKSVNLHNMSLYEDAVTVKFHVKNTGEWDGHEVSQLYLVSSRTSVKSGGGKQLTKIVAGFP